ncbi:LysR family transcriptional regulator [Schlegelella sp. S2-27]|uniref:LysR family transcriptional regulator n=1 Tax=Caldimonas mangrovi TaxID=2944811 RepID=A0ABT0YVM7_9BURK|nr:LysR family transcriptional regulator [Caldimonas mangrovi]MCM5682805.1 LysR family transcriptional regulator [Caldimonas mangrovi]
MNLPLNALRAFEASARHLSFTRAAIELNVTQSAVSAQVKSLEQRLGTPLFRRLPRGLALTDEGQALLPMLAETFHRIGAVLDQFRGGRLREALTVAAVGTFAVGWLMPRLEAFHRDHPFVDLRLMMNNNRVDLAGEGLDYAIRFGDGAWHGTEAEPLMQAPLSPVCTPELAVRLHEPADLARETLLRSYRADEWTRWFAAAGVAPPLLRGPVFDSSVTMAAAAVQGMGIALLPPTMFALDLRHERLVQPFDIQVPTGRYWLTRLKSKPVSAPMREFRQWLLAAMEEA